MAPTSDKRTPSVDDDSSNSSTSSMRTRLTTKRPAPRDDSSTDSASAPKEARLEQPVVDPTFCLPAELWERVLLENVVSQATQSGLPLKTAIGQVALVNKFWHEIAMSDHFRIQAVAELVRRDPTRRYLRTATPVRCRGLAGGNIKLMTMLDGEVYVLTNSATRRIEVYDTHSYCEGRGSLILHPSRTFLVNPAHGLFSGNLSFQQPVGLISYSRTKHLYMFDAGHMGNIGYVWRVDALTGVADDIWLIARKDCMAMAMAEATGRLLLAFPDEIQLYNARGELQKIPIPPTEQTLIKDVLPLPDGRSYLVCHQTTGGMSDQLTVLSDQGLVIARHPLPYLDLIFGCVVDERGCVVLLVSNCVDFRLVVLRPDTLLGGHTLLQWTLSPGTSIDRQSPPWSQLWFDVGRGLLFSWTTTDLSADRDVVSAYRVQCPVSSPEMLL